MAKCRNLQVIRFYGAIASWMVLGITLYWPVVAWTEHYFFARAVVKYQPFDVITNGILAIIFLFAGWASWYLSKNHKLFE
jgi:hypothetical protein